MQIILSIFRYYAVPDDVLFRPKHVLSELSCTYNKTLLFVTERIFYLGESSLLSSS